MNERPKAPAEECPYQDLHIYYLEGCAGGDPGDFGPSYIGNWIEEGYSFLFFSRPADEAVARMLAAEPGLVLVDRYEMRYEDWLGERFKRFQAGGFLIVPPWDPSPDGGHRRRITLDPGVVFGTGTHPTTRDCLEFVERVAGEPAVRTAVDVGTGTGLLALAAARAGCRKVLAFDVNLLAVRTARKNVLLNRLEDRVLAVQGSAHEMADAPADLMIANIHYDVMTGLVASGSLLNKRWLILSGLLRSQAADVLKALSDLPVEVMETRQQDGIWHTFLGKVRR